MAFSPIVHVSNVPMLTARQRWLGILRILFGVVWAVAAALKWQPAFIKGFADIVQGAMDGQPQPVKLWIAFWLGIIHVNPSLFAHMEAITETALALCFILGAFTNLACVVGILLSLGIWTVAEGFGGPYIPGQTVDVGTALPYAILCGVLLCASAGQYYGLDHLLVRKLGRFSFLASSSLTRVDEEARVAQPVKEREMVRQGKREQR
ncbi:MAG TPA: DoxX family protein [Ktedonobacteraceae bacterium]|nr:DoxX family protein [Ktedonobacteraceae bacterium]